MSGCQSGTKINHAHGITAIRDGVRINPNRDIPNAQPRPAWLKMSLATSSTYHRVQKIVHEHGLSTVCEEARCPNISECWTAGTATLMLMGAVCTRACQFCSVDTGNPKGWLDLKEPQSAAKAVQLMGLKYVVLTSVNRDDLKDGGAAHYAACVAEVKRVNPETVVEVLTPDFQGRLEDVEVVLTSGISVFAQNIETVKRLTHPVRDPRAGYEQTLKVLEYAKKSHPELLTKTSIMLGLGETDRELQETMRDLRAVGVDILTLGQYLRPTLNHLPVQRYVHPDEFEQYRQWGLESGFLEVVSGVQVRSSYRAEQALSKNNVGLSRIPVKVEVRS